MEINQKFKDQEFVIKDELEIELNIMSRAHLGMKTFEEQIKRITKEIEDEEKKEERPKSPLKKRKTEMNMLKFMDPKPPKENKPKQSQNQKPTQNLTSRKNNKSKSPKRPNTGAASSRKGVKKKQK